ncbi:MAG: hypothetical protein GKR94_26465 [Gammaproteobacteria bacterium]|nr:hypothetical protein [Gammaproteobacteria bacterium]
MRTDYRLREVTLAQAYAEPLHLLCETGWMCRYLVDRYGDEVRAGGATAWRRPLIDTLTGWAQRQYRRLLDEGFERRVLLGPHQCALVWEAVIREWARDEVLLGVRETAKSAMHAARLSAEWSVPLDRLASYGGDETRAFVEWQRTVHARFEANGWLSPDAVFARITAALAAGELDAPPHLALLLADEKPAPGLSALIGALRDAGCEVLRAVSPPQRASAVRVEVVNPAVEEEWAARWAWARMNAAPRDRVAIAAPAIRERDDGLGYQLSRLWRCHGGGEGEPPFVPGVADALAASPVADTALALLELALRPLPLASAGALVRSPFLPHAQLEYAARAQLDVVMRASGGAQVSLSALIRWCGGRDEAAGRCPELAARLRRMRALMRQQAQRQTLPDWGRAFTRLLAAAGWPGHADSGDPDAKANLSRRLLHDQQVFQDLFAALGQLGAVVGSCSAARALQLLLDLAGETVRDMAKPQARIHLLDAADAARVHFDAVWMLGAHDGAWPPAPLQNPFLPVALMRAAGIPGTTAEDALRLARDHSARLWAAAPEVVISHASADAQKPMRVSPLMQALPVVAVSGLGLAGSADTWPSALGQAQMESLTDDRGPGLEQGAKAPGGTAFIAAQSACPFRAFATHRLGVRRLEAPVVGIDFKLSGELIHDLLCRVWEHLGDSRALAAAGDPDTLVAAAMPPVAAALRQHNAQLAASRLLTLELDRIKRLVVRWLEFERDRREAPFTIASLEQAAQIEIGPLSIGVRADRIDRLEDGRLVVIDYKTGATVSVAGWDEARMREPQVPLYAVGMDGPVGGAALAHVRAGALAFKGVAAADHILPRVKADKDGVDAESWDERLARWQAALSELALEAQSGAASVTPAAKSVCEHCPLAGACRIGEGAGGGADDEEEALLV